MNDSARIYRAVILRAIYGPGYNTAKVADLKRLNEICEHLAECEEAQRILKRKGHGKPGMTFSQVVATVPPSPLGWLRGAFRPLSSMSAEDKAKLDESFNIWLRR